MKLKVKFLGLSAGRPVAILHKKLAEKSGIHVDERVTISQDGKKIVAVVDTATKLLKEDELAVSNEVVEAINIKENQLVDVDLSVKPESLSLIMKKMSCKPLSQQEINQIIKDIVDNNLTESEIAYFISAVYECGMSTKEIVEMIKAIISNGKKLGLKGMIADKHSIGGISGRTTPIIVSICACTGLIIPKTSSRAITSPAGTADAIESVCRVDFSIPEIKKIIKKTNACFVWGGSLNLAPADDKIIQVEKIINIDPEPQLLASILAKKIAVGSKYILIDIPYGKYAKVNKKEALSLAKKFKNIGKYFKLKIDCLLKETNEPLGNGIGPALEMIDVVKVLKRESPCHLLEQRSLELAGKLLELTGKSKKGSGFLKAKEILESGQAFKKFKEIVKAQKGNLKNIENKKAKFSLDIKSKKSGKIKDINIKLINTLARITGCPLNKFAGIYLHKHLNESIKKGEKILTLYSETEKELKTAGDYYNKIEPIDVK